MSGNKLLAENTIRRFMKLANTEAMTDSFMEAVGRYPGMRDEEDDDAPAMRAPAMREEEEVQEESFEIEDLNEEEDEEMELDAEMGAEMDEEPAGDEMGAADMSLTEEEAQLLISLGERLAAAMEGEEGDAPSDDMDDMDMMDDEEGAPEDEEMMEEEFDQDDLVNEVLKRVTKRLVAEKLKTRK